MLGARKFATRFWRPNRRLKLPERAIDLAGDLAQTQPILAKQFGVQQGKGGDQRKRQAQDRQYPHQAVVGNKARRSAGRAVLRPMFTGVQEPVLERRVLGEVIPAAVLVLPAVVSQSADRRCGNAWASRVVIPNQW